MGLRDLQTIFTSLKFGNDRLGGGKSDQPYVVSPIIKNESELNFYRFNPDFPIRGGLISAINTGKDLLRVGRFLTDPVRGPLFIAKQVGLQLSNPKIETSKQIGIENTRIYNLGANTLAQIASSAFGIHFERHGLTLNLDAKDKYESIVRKKDTNLNRLSLLYDIKILKNTTNLAEAKKIGISDRDSELFRYSGGPESFLGIGNTVIKKTSNYYESNDINGTIVNGLYSGSFARDFSNQRSVNIPINYYNMLGLSKKYGSRNVDSGIDVNNPTNKPYQFITSGKDAKDNINLRLRNDSDNEKGINTWTSGMFNFANAIYNTNSNEVQDFRKILKDSGSFIPSKADKIPNFDYTDKLIKRQTRVLMGDPGLKGVSRIKYNDGTKNTATQDRITMLPLYQSDGPLGTEYTRDLVKFRFEILNNDNPTLAVFAHFRAFLTNITDNWQPEWNSFNYIGRGEKFQTYNGFTRNISFGFKVHAQSREEMKPIYQKLNYLASAMTPDYNSQKFMRGNIIKLTLGDYVYSLPGIITSLTYKIPDESPWEIAMQEPENGGIDNDMHELPHLIEVDVNFTPIHSFVPSKSAIKPFITPNSAEGNAFLWSKAKNNPNLIHSPSQFTGGLGQNLKDLMIKK